MKTLADFKRAMVKGSQWYRKHVNESAWTERILEDVPFPNVSAGLDLSLWRQLLGRIIQGQCFIKRLIEVNTEFED